LKVYKSVKEIYFFIVDTVEELGKIFQLLECV